MGFSSSSNGQTWRPAAHFGSAQAGVTSPGSADPRPNTLEIKGFGRGHYPNVYEKHWNTIKINLDEDIAASAKPSFPYGKPFYRIKFESFDDAMRAKEIFKNLEYTDERRGASTPLRVVFLKDIDAKKAGYFRHFFYDHIKTFLMTADKTKGKEVKMRIISQMLVADVEGEPFELVFLPQETGKPTCKVVPKWDTFDELGITREQAKNLIDAASNAANQAA